MNILAVDTSGSQAAIAALESGTEELARPLAITTIAEPRQLSRQIIVAIESTLRRASWTLDDVNGIAVGLGPGSWTSLRIGLTTCKTLAQVRGWGLAGVPTFDAMAQAVWRRERLEVKASVMSHDSAVHPSGVLPEHFVLLATGRCRAGEIYGKIYECHPDYLAHVQPEWVGQPEAMADAAAEALAGSIEASLVLVGDAASSVSDVLAQRHEAHRTVSLSIESLVVELGRASAAALEQGHADSPLELQPLYVAPSAAERNRKLAV